MIDPSGGMFMFAEEILEDWLWELENDASIPFVCSTVPLLPQARSRLICFLTELDSEEVLELCRCDSPDSGSATLLFSSVGPITCTFASLI